MLDQDLDRAGRQRSGPTRAIPCRSSVPIREADPRSAAERLPFVLDAAFVAAIVEAAVAAVAGLRKTLICGACTSCSSCCCCGGDDDGGGAFGRRRIPSSRTWLAASIAEAAAAARRRSESPTRCATATPSSRSSAPPPLASTRRPSDIPEEKTRMTIS